MNEALLIKSINLSFFIIIAMTPHFLNSSVSIEVFPQKYQAEKRS